jgi:hypothetical protein
MSIALAIDRNAPVLRTSDQEQDRNDELSMLVDWVEEAMQASMEENALAQRDIDYYHTMQYSAEERRILAERGQPCITDNKIKSKINILAGLELKARADPAAWPRTPQDEDNADACTKALRYVKDDNDYDVIRSMAYLDMLVPGMGGLEVIAGEKPKGKNAVRPIIYNLIPWDRWLRDPHSRFPDFRDAKYLGTVIWMDKDDALDLYPDAANDLEIVLNSGMGDRTYDDRPYSQIWLDAKRQRVRFVQMNYRYQGEWKLATFTKGAFLADPEVSEYVDREGKSAPQFFAASAYVNKFNHRYGYARDLIDLQDEINKRRSKALHQVSMRQIQYEDGAVEDIDETRRQVAKPDGAIKTNNGFLFKVLDNEDMAEGQFKLLQQAEESMASTGPNASMAGKDDRDLSGKAIIAQQAGGSLELAPIADALRQLDKRVYEATWLRIRQFWNAEKWIRVTKDDKTIEWVGLNRKITLGMALQSVPPDQAQAQMQRIGITGPNDPRLNDVIHTENDVENMDVDITVDDAPEFPTLAAEQFTQLTDLAGAGVPIPPKILIQASSLRNKKDLLDQMDDAQAAQAQTQQAAQQMAVQKTTADIQKTQAQTAHLQAGTVKTHADAVKAGADAQNTQANTILTNAEANFASHRARQAAVEAYAAASGASLIDQARRSQESVLPGVH